MKNKKVTEKEATTNDKFKKYVFLRTNYLHTCLYVL